MHELTITTDVLPALPVLPAAGLRRRRGSISVRKNVCLFTLNGSWNGLSFWNIANGFGGF